MVASPVTATELWPFVVTKLWDSVGAEALDVPAPGSSDPLDALTSALVDAEILTHATAHVQRQAALVTLK
jgi:hypothetical protein